MRTLIWREIVDHAAYLLLVALLSAIMTAPLVFREVMGLEAEVLVVVICVLPFALLGCCALGVGQMAADRAGRISSFLSTQAVTRGQILWARLLVGLLAVLIVLVPVGIAAVIVLQRTIPFMFYFMLYSHWVARIYAIAFLVAMANYGLGLQIGWHTRKVILLFGALLLPATVMALVVIKGFTADTIIVLLALILALAVSVALRFHSTPL